MPDSSTGGFLVPSSTPPATDQDLENIVQELIVGLTGLNSDFVVPRYDPGFDNQPEVTVNWCAVSVMDVRPDPNPAIEHISTGDGSSSLSINERIEVLASFYGPQGQQYAGIARDGLYIPQNNGWLKQYDMGLVTVGTVRSVPELINKQWRRRFDLPFTLRRKVSRTYSVLNLVEADLTLQTDDTPPIVENVDVIDS